jgi:hypothetical protein
MLNELSYRTIPNTSLQHSLVPYGESSRIVPYAIRNKTHIK